MRVQWPFVVAGTLGFHLVVAMLADVYRVCDPPIDEEPQPTIEMVEVATPEPEPPPLPPPPPPKADEPPPPDPTPARPQPPAPHLATHERPPPPPPETPPSPPAPPETPIDPAAKPGGEPVVHMDDIAPTDHGVAVARGTPHDRVGPGGSGGGTGSGSGSGNTGDAAPPPPAPISIAKLKAAARPRGDYSYFDAGKDYPPDARRLGIEGTIKVKLVVDDTGHVVSAALVTHLGYGLDELALARAKALTFTPAIDTDDHPTRSLVIWTFNMTLPK